MACSLLCTQASPRSAFTPACPIIRAGCHIASLGRPQQELATQLYTGRPPTPQPMCRNDVWQLSIMKGHIACSGYVRPLLALSAALHNGSTVTDHRSGAYPATNTVPDAVKKHASDRASDAKHVILMQTAPRRCRHHALSQTSDTRRASALSPLSAAVCRSTYCIRCALLPRAALHVMV